MTKKLAPRDFASAFYTDTNLEVMTVEVIVLQETDPALILDVSCNCYDSTLTKTSQTTRIVLTKTNFTTFNSPEAIFFIVDLVSDTYGLKPMNNNLIFVLINSKKYTEQIRWVAFKHDKKPSAKLLTSLNTFYTLDKNGRFADNVVILKYGSSAPVKYEDLKSLQSSLFTKTV
jgi:hypothetical protein